MTKATTVPDAAATPTPSSGMDRTLPDGNENNNAAVDNSSEIVKLTSRPLLEEILACAVP